MTNAALPPDFDPGRSAYGDGIYGLPCTVEASRVVVVPVPFEATVSYHTGTVKAPEAILTASWQVDLFDVETGRPYEQGIAMLDLAEAVDVISWSEAARELAAPVLAAGGPGDAAGLRERASRVDALCERMNGWVHSHVAEQLDAGKTVFVVGGDHSVPFGAFQAYAERHPGLGILHFDAHYDLRPAYEGFQWSHASVMRNALDLIPNIARIVHVGIRDFSEEEHETSRADDRSVAFLQSDLRRRLHAGESWSAIVDDIVEALPREVYVSFDIDGLDPTLCPGTGTPVPDGLLFDQATSLLAAVVASGRRIIGGDLVEVAPTEGDRDWNANVGSRLLYKMIGFAVSSSAP